MENEWNEKKKVTYKIYSVKLDKMKNEKRKQQMIKSMYKKISINLKENQLWSKGMKNKK